MKKKYIIGLVAIATIIFCALCFYYFKTSVKANQSTKIEVYTIVAAEKVFINGVIAPVETEDIYLDASKGNVNKISVKDGQIVKKGDALFTYRSDQVTEQIQQAKLQLESSKNQKKDLQVSTSSIDSQIKLYEEQITSLKQKEYSTVVAPIEGKVILHEDAKVGTTPYITIENTKLYIKGTVSEKDQPKLKADQLAEITILSANNIVKGKIASIGNRPVTETMAAIGAASTASAATSNISYYEVKINLDSQDNLTNGFHVQAVVKLTEGGIKIPKSAILQEGETHYVYRVVNKKLSKQVITYSDSDSDTVKVTSGLKESEEIVKKPTSNMKEGTTIE